MPEAPVLFYSPFTCAASEILAFEWAGIPYRLCRVSRDERKGEAFRAALNPNGQVPVLLFPDGRVLSENAAILAWIGDQVPEKGLTPAFDTPERYVFYYWLSWFDSTFHAAHTPLFAPGRIHPDPSQHEAIKAQAAIAIAELLPRVERHLEGREFFFLDRMREDPAVQFLLALEKDGTLNTSPSRAFRGHVAFQEILALERGASR